MPRQLDEVKVAPQVAELERGQPALVVPHQFAGAAQLEIGFGHLEAVIGFRQHFQALVGFSGFAALLPLVVAALYWKRATKEGAYAGIIAAMVAWLYYFHQSGYGGEYVVGPGIVPAAICFVASAVALVAVSLATKPPSNETIDKFFPDAASVG